MPRHWRDIRLIAEQVLCLAVRNKSKTLLDPDNPGAGGRNARRPSPVGGNGQRRNTSRNRNRCAATRAATASTQLPWV